MSALLARLDLRQLWLLGAGVLAVLVAVLLMDAVRPQLRGYRAAVEAERTLRASQASTPSLERDLAERGEQVAALGERLHGEMTDVPARELEAVVIGRLQNISWRHGVELASVLPKRGEQVDVFDEQLFDVELSGHYEELYAWVLDLRSELAFAVVKSFAVQRTDDDGAAPMLRATLTLASYRTHDT